MQPIAAPHAPISDGFVALRRFFREDVPAVVTACQDSEIPRWTVVPTPYGEADALDWIDTHDALRAAGSAAPFAIVDAETGVLAGSIGVHDIDWRSRTGEVGYWVAREFRQLGVASRALALVSRWALEDLRLMRLVLLADVRNAPSQSVARRAGYHREGVLRSAREIKGERCDMVLFSLLPADLR